MPLTPIKYENTIIYKLEHSVDKSLIYVGSTTDFKSRKKSHKSDCYNETRKSYNQKVYKMIRENGGWESFQMLEIKKFPCKDKREAEAEEERCRVELKATLNTQKAFRSDDEKKEYTKEYNKQYRLENADELREKKEKYNKRNEDKITERRNKYRAENIDKILERDKKYRNEHNAKFECMCGGRYTSLNKSAHFKSKLHLKSNQAQ